MDVNKDFKTPKPSETTDLLGFSSMKDDYQPIHAKEIIIRKDASTGQQYIKVNNKFIPVAQAKMTEIIPIPMKRIRTDEELSLTQREISIKQKAREENLQLRENLVALATKNINAEHRIIELEKQVKDLKELMNRKVDLKEIGIQTDDEIVNLKTVYENNITTSNDAFEYSAIDQDMILCDVDEIKTKLDYISGNLLIEDVNMGSGPQIIMQNVNNFECNWKLNAYACYMLCDKMNSEGDYPIHVAVSNKDLTAVKRQCRALNFKKKSVNLENEDGYTPLHLAISNDVGREIISLLLSNHARFDYVDRSGNNCYHLAVQYNYLSKLDFDVLKNHKFCVDKFNFDGETPLLICARKNQLQDAKILISIGADLNQHNKKNGRTALFYAVENNSSEMVQILLQHGANIKATNFTGLSPQDVFYDKDRYDPVLMKIFSDIQLQHRT